MDLDTSFGHWLHTRRRALDLTQDDLARRVGCALVTIQKLEADERRPSRQIAERLADCLKIPADDRAAFITLARGEPYHDPAAEAAEHPLCAPERPLTNLAAPLTRLIGRKQDIAAVRNTLLRGEVRLLTLVGPPGIGKTRLSIAVAREVQAAFSDGVSFVVLAPLGDPALVLATIAQTLGMAERAGQPLLETLKAVLQAKRRLLLLDNFEHLLDAAPLVVELLEACPGLKALITSRAALRVRGERLYAVPPLLLPNLTQLPATVALARNPAVALFVERAQDVLPHFQLTAQNAAVVAAICVRLDGLPLAIELAAARIRLLPPEALLARLEQRLAVLTDGARDLPPRHRTLRAAIGWSYDLLDASEQVLFRRLSVFVGGWTLEAAGAVPNASGDLPLDVLDGLAALVDKSLLREEGGDDEPRFVMLETVRQYAAEKLDEAGETELFRARHCDWFLQVAEEAYLEQLKTSAAMSFDQLAREHDNLRAALDWSLRHDHIVKALRLCYLLDYFWGIRAHWSEGRAWIERALAVANFDSKGAGPQEIALWAQGLCTLGILAVFQRDFAAAQDSLVKSVGLYRNLARSQVLSAEEKNDMGAALNYLGFTAYYQGDYARATALYQEALSLYRELRNTRGAGFTLSMLGRAAIHQGQYNLAAGLGQESAAIGRKLEHVHLTAAALDVTGRALYSQGDFQRARSLLEESLSLSKELDYQQDVADTLNILGLVEFYQGEYRRATELLEEALALSQSLKYSMGQACSLRTQAEVALAERNTARAKALLVESLASFRQLGLKWYLTRCLEIKAAIDVAEHQSARAARLFGAASALRETLGAPLPPPDRSTYDCAVESARGQLGKQAFAAAWDAGQAMPLEQAIEYALNATSSAPTPSHPPSPIP
jgi:predicted ATPase/DNA-binding XRE family transcriptional regulator